MEPIQLLLSSMRDVTINRMVNRLKLAFVVALSFVGLTNAQAPADANRTLVLAELFTSEGCNSCPPADHILEMLSKEQPLDGVYVVALSEHVTYWDHQGRKDPFGSTRFTERQNMYGFRFNLDSVFTPQLVIDGSVQVVGSDTDKLNGALADAARRSKPRVTVEASLNDKGLTASASGPGLAAGAAEGADLLWAVAEDDLVVEVKRGENAKRTLRHSGVVRSLSSRRIDSANTAGMTSGVIPLRPEWKRENLRVVAFVQSAKTKRVLSVGWARLPIAP